MKLMILSIVCGVALSAMVALADKPTTAPAVPATQPTVNANCAVETDHAVDPTVFVMYHGKKIGFCCEDCVNEFNADPEKYVSKMK